MSGHVLKNFGKYISNVQVIFNKVREALADNGL